MVYFLNSCIIENVCKYENNTKPILLDIKILIIMLPFKIFTYIILTSWQRINFIQFWLFCVSVLVFGLNTQNFLYLGIYNKLPIYFKIWSLKLNLTRIQWFHSFFTYLYTEISSEGDFSSIQFFVLLFIFFFFSQ